MDVRTCLRLVRRHWWIVLVTLMLTVGSAALVTVRTAPRYVASVTFFVTAPNQGVSNAYQGELFLQQRVKSYADLLRSDRLAQAMVAETALGLTADDVQRRVATSTEPGTVLLRATVTDTDQARAMKVTEALSAKFVELVKKIETTSDGKAGPTRIEVVGGPGSAPARSPRSPTAISPSVSWSGSCSAWRSRCCAAWSTCGCATPPGCSGPPVAPCSATSPSTRAPRRHR
ncbi:YveK family protein [Micromonospora sp. RL09-050-HVF-A]|uniref:YveK family protein n=1 Tax=Micromonospora sp. RL09-050-HVF-A TaxID=1703433 RepID=UPI002102D8AE|nr:Wzz/FepE/Etk N-terminal domain-containing protein [Micromonospora sp. RL09-050-HVF-A]